MVLSVGKLKMDAEGSGRPLTLCLRWKAQARRAEPPRRNQGRVCLPVLAGSKPPKSLCLPWLLGCLAEPLAAAARNNLTNTDRGAGRDKPSRKKAWEGLVSPQARLGLPVRAAHGGTRGHG